MLNHGVIYLFCHFQTQQAEEKPPSTEAAPDQSPAEFWSRLKNTQGKPVPMMPKELNQSGENKPSSAPTSPTNHQSHTTKLEDKELETRKERPQSKEPKVPAVSHNGEAVNKLGEVAKTVEVKPVETSSNCLLLESCKTEQRESPKQTLLLEKELVTGKVELSKEASCDEAKQQATELKTTPPKPDIEGISHANATEARTAWSKEPPENKEPKGQEKSPKNNVIEIEEELKKTEELPFVKQSVRGVIRMTNLNSKPQQAADIEVETAHRDDIKLLKKDDTPSLKSALVGESSVTSAPEKKTVTFAEPLNEDGEIKVLVNTGKDLTCKDGKREILVPSTLGIVH